MKLNFIVLAFMAITLSACQSRDGDITLFSVQDDLALGEKIKTQIDNDPVNFPVLEKNDHPELYTIMENLVNEILRSHKIYYKEELAWKIKVINNDTICNAFCTPGGFIYVYTGLIKFVKSEDELAGVIAHEVAHGDLRHSTDQLTKIYGLQLLARILTDGEGELLAQLGVNLLGLKFSRSDETQADAFAVQYLSDTDYNPIAFADFFARMKEQNNEEMQIEFLSTHPDPGNRIEKINAVWKEEGQRKGKDHSESFKRLLKSLP